MRSVLLRSATRIAVHAPAVGPAYAPILRLYVRYWGKVLTVTLSAAFAYTDPLVEAHRRESTRARTL
jgi:hypothetical protein